MSKLLNIGVVTPTHPSRNDAMLRRASHSVWRQTHPAAGHFVVCDWEKKGAAWTRQAALEANTFEWTAFLDSDDWFMPNHLEVLVNAALETGADYVYTWYELVHLGRRFGDNDPVFPPGHFLDPWDPANPRHTTMTVMVRTELAREVGFVTVPDDGEYAHRRGEDWEFTLGCNAKGTIHHVVQRTWFWDHHGKNSSGVPGHGDA